MLQKYNEIINTEAGLITSCLYKLPNRSFLPQGLFLTALQGENLDVFDCNFSTIKAGGIGFTMEHSLMSSIGEFCERYSSGIVNQKKVLFSSYNKIIKSGLKAIHPNDIKIFSEEQYNSVDFPFRKLQLDDELTWIECFDYFTDEVVYIPNFLVYFGKSVSDNRYNYQTSTGIACANDIPSAFKGAFLEDCERHAFVDFWYNQKEIEFIKYSKNQILKAFPHSKNISTLFDNNNLHITIFDLTKHSVVESIVAFMYFKFKDKYYQTMGSASRFTKEDAIIKAMLECYQGVEYAIGLDKTDVLKDILETEHSKIDNFERHFAFYNKFPHLRENVPILKEAMIDGNYASDIVFEKNKLKSINKEDLKKFNITKLFYVDLTTVDISELGNKVTRVIMPDYALLSSIHEYPFLGNEIFKNKFIFNEYPHPFP